MLRGPMRSPHLPRVRHGPTNTMPDGSAGYPLTTLYAFTKPRLHNSSNETCARLCYAPTCISMSPLPDIRLETLGSVNPFIHSLLILMLYDHHCAHTFLPSIASFSARFSMTLPRCSIVCLLVWLLVNRFTRAGGWGNRACCNLRICVLYNVPSSVLIDTRRVCPGYTQRHAGFYGV